jgi:steroid 5-alpha reductase family enzyme
LVTPPYKKNCRASQRRRHFVHKNYVKALFFSAFHQLAVFLLQAAASLFLATEPVSSDAGLEVQQKAQKGVSKVHMIAIFLTALLREGHRAAICYCGIYTGS